MTGLGSHRAGVGEGLRARAVVLGLLLSLPAWAGEVVRTVAGKAGIPGHADGPGTVARFADPAGLAFDPVRGLYIADSANHCVRRRNPDGTVVTIAGRPGEAGSADGPALNARFDGPAGLALGADGRLWIADAGNHVIRVLETDGRVRTVAGLAGDPGATNAVGSAARFSSPLGLAVAPGGWVAVADSGNHALRRVSTDGAVSTLAGELEDWGTADGPAAEARFQSPVSVAFDGPGRLWISDSGNHTVRRLGTDGVVTTPAGRAGEDGSADGTGAAARFSSPAGLVVDERGRVYLADSFNQTLRRISPEGAVATVAGVAGARGAVDGESGAGRFFNPYGLAAVPGGSLFVSDSYNHLVREVRAPFALWVEAPTGRSLGVRWESVAGRRYRILGREELERPWRVLAESVAGLADETHWPDPEPAARRYYQVEELD